MIETVLFFLLYAAVLLFGVLLSYAFAGVPLSRRGLRSVIITFVVCGVLQLIVYHLFGEQIVWELYPLITHLPLVAVLCFFHRKQIVTVLPAVAAAYLCCQPANWAGIFTATLTQSIIAEQSVRLVIILATGYIALRYVAPYLSKLLTKDFRSICIFGSIPMVYYLFDYITGIYESLWLHHTQLTMEFIPFVLCVFFVVFCTMYYKEYERKADAERREQMIQIAIQQQQNQIEAVKRTAKELQLLRHDMRLILSGIAVSIENNELENAKEMIQGYSSRIEDTKLEHFCEYDFINAVLSDFASRCKADNIPFSYIVDIDVLKVDELLLCSLLSNALDNALNAQKQLPQDKQSIRLMLKNSDGKLLLSVKNAIYKAPTFVDGVPVTNRKDHGFGTQSICYITEKLDGKYQFSVHDNLFTVRIVL